VRQWKEQGKENLPHLPTDLVSSFFELKGLGLIWLCRLGDGYDFLPRDAWDLTCSGRLPCVEGWK